MGTPTDEELDNSPPGGWLNVPAWPEIFGGIAAIVPFVIVVEKFSVANGKLTSYSNIPALVGGVIALLCGIAGLVLLKKTIRANKLKRIVMAVLLVGVGGYQIARSQGTFFKPGSVSLGTPDKELHLSIRS